MNTEKLQKILKEVKANNKFYLEHNNNAIETRMLREENILEALLENLNDLQRQINSKRDL